MENKLKQIIKSTMLTSKKIKKSFIPLFVVSAIVIVPLLFTIGFIIGNQVPIKVALSNTDSIATWLSAIATIVIAGLTFILAKETWYLREAQIQQLSELKSENIRPNVSIQLESSRVDANFMNVKVSNLGKGIAKKIVFEFLDKQGNQIHENHDEYVVIEKFRKLAIFRLGIESMGINQVISSYIFNFIHLHDELKIDITKPYFDITIKFEDTEGNSYTNIFAIDFMEFEGISKIVGDEDALHQISKELKKISEHIENITGNSSQRIGVNVFNTTDRKDEREKLEKLYNAK
jgi:hypothetical protein